MPFKDLLYDKKGGIARITINRPEALNAFRTQTLLDLIEAFEDAVVGFFEVAGVGCVVFDDRIVAPAVG